MILPGPMRNAARRARRFASSARSRLNNWRMRRLGKRFPLPSITLSDLVHDIRNAPNLILDDICLPPYFGPATVNDVQAFQQIVLWQAPTTVVEFGTAHGNTVANICSMCPSARVYTINAAPEQLSGKVVTFTLSRQDIGRVYRAHGFSDRVTQIFANTLSVNLQSYLRDQSVDLAIIDACHDTPFVINDFKKVEPYVRRGGIVMFHDTHPSRIDHLFGSYDACVCLRKLGYDILHLQDTWWGIWRKP